MWVSTSRVAAYLCAIVVTACGVDSAPASTHADTSASDAQADTSTASKADTNTDTNTDTNEAPDSSGVTDTQIAPIDQVELLAHFGLNIGPVKPDKSGAGDVLFGIGFLPIGIFGGPDPEGAGTRPNIGFRVPHGTKIRSPLAAKLQYRIFQAGYGDWELHLVGADGQHPKWLIILDHVAGTVPDIGAGIALDQELGVAAPMHKDWALYEIHVLQEASKSSAPARHRCPLSAMTPAARTLAEQQLSALFAARTQPPYRFGAAPVMVAPGCICWTITEPAGQTHPQLVCDP